MPRNRIGWFPGALYHVVSRGSRRAPIFFHDRDRLKYFNLLHDTRQVFPFELHAYCLMTNHVHLLIEVDETPLGPIMQKLNHRYAVYFNRTHESSGHVFQGPYFATQITSIDDKLATSKYIHLNPVEAGLVKNAEDYPWSSCKAYVTGAFDSRLTSTSLLTHFKAPERKAYYDFLQEPEFSVDFSKLKPDWRDSRQQDPARAKVEK
ncbi:transposase [Bacillus marinisedimentorum]|uniref:transposase n=1 Tax=Bacillus marinisedimentorum TaxID=1821260 RepID=UPI0007DF1DA7|nr:transposase [Bacillus marinisedimentorum]